MRVSGEAWWYKIWEKTRGVESERGGKGGSEEEGGGGETIGVNHHQNILTVLSCVSTSYILLNHPCARHAVTIAPVAFL
jgi:hypothetical protein